MVNSINNQIPTDPKVVSQNTTENAKSSKDPKSTTSSTIMDTVTLTQTPEPATTYTNTISPEEMAGRSYELLRELVTNMLKEQGIDFKVATGSSEIDISSISQEEAQELVSEDGYFGVEQTSDRIVDLAIAAAGGDTSKLDAIKEGVEKGFNEALEIFGGQLPDISYDTYDAVMEKLDAWAAQTDGKEGTTINR